eukprot:XP_011680834.1 PREDICTED: uncharacterized protein LOC590700 [Strongylocentrotus purpuratus]
MSALKWITHICQAGPLHRYVNLFVTGMEARRTRDALDFERLFNQQSDVCMLRLFESFMESAPQVVLQLYIMVATNDENFWTGTSAAVSLFSLCWALGAYSRAHRKVRRDKKVVSWPGLVLQTLWRIGMISSRVMALVLFASVFKAYIFLAVGIHWIGMMVWVHLQKTDFCTHPLEERLFNCVVAVIYIFCFFNLKEGKSRKRVLVFYSIMFVENTVLLLVWYSYRTIGEWYNVAGFTIVFGGYGIGVVSMILYYRYLHPRNDFTLCGPKPEKEPSRSLNTTPSMSPASSPAALFSPELYRHGHSPSPKQQRRSDVNHNDNAASPLARPLSQTSIHLDDDFDKEHGVPQRSGKVKGQGHKVGRGDSIVRKSKSESCVSFNENETISPKVHLDKSTAGNSSVLMNASLMASFRCEISGFGTDLVQKFDDWRDHSRLTNHSVMSAGGKSGNLTRSLGSMLDQSHVPSPAAAHCIDSADAARTPFSPDLQQMPEIADSPNQIMTAYEAQQIYDSILGIHHPRRNSKRKLKFDDDPGKASGRTRSKSGNAVVHGKPAQKETGNRSGDGGFGNGGPQRVVVTRKYVKDGCCVGRIGTSGQLLDQSKQSHHPVPNLGTKNRDKCSEGSHKILTHPANNAVVETKTKEIYPDNGKKIETETTNFQAVKVDMPIDLEGAKPLQGSKDNHDLGHVINEKQKGIQNQNKPSILIVDVNSARAEHETQIGIAAPRLRAALSRDLFKAKERVISRSSHITNKADVHNEGCDKAASVLGCKSDNVKGIVAYHDEFPIVVGRPAEHNEETAIDASKSEPNAHAQSTKDLQCATTVLNSNDKTKQGHNIYVKHSGKLASGLEDSRITEREEEDNRDPCENSNAKAQRNSPTKAGKLLGSLSPKAAIFSTSQGRFNGSHSPLIGGEREPGGSRHKYHGRSPAGKTALKRVRSLKGSVPLDSLSLPQGSSPARDDSGKGHSEHERTPIANLKGKIKRALSIKAKIPYEGEVHVDSSPSIKSHLDHDPRRNDNHKTEKALNTISSPQVNVDKASELVMRERPVLVENQQSAPKSAFSPQKFEAISQSNKINPPQKTGVEPYSLPTTTLSSPRGEENRGFAPVSGNMIMNTSPQKNTENTKKYSGSPQKTGKEHLSLSKGTRVRTPGKENRGFQPGTVKGTVSRQTNNKLGSPTGKKPPRRSLNRIPTNLVADNVARFDSPSK